MKKWSILLLACVLAIALVGCGKESTEGKQTSEGKEKWIMATSADYPPYEYIDTASGKEEIIGFDIEVANLIAEELGIEYEIINMDFNGLLAALQSNQADFVMAGMTPNEERAQSVDFSIVYYGGDNTNTILALKDSNIQSPEDLVGKKVGAQLGTAQEQAAKQLEGIEYTALNKIPELVQEVLAGRLDAIIIESEPAENYVKNNEKLQFTPFSAEGLNGVAVAFPKGSDKVEKVNKAIEKLKENGKIDELIEKWMK